MGNLCVNNNGPDRQRSIEIEEELRKYKSQLLKEKKILLLGPGESGKSTVFKQMKIIQDDGGFTKEELQGFRHIVHANCISQMRVLVQAAARQRQPFQNQNNVNLAAELLQLPTAGHVWTPDVGKSIKALWNDSGIRAVYSMAGSLYQLNDTADYFFDSIDRYMQPDFCPSVDDVLRVRVRSTGIEEAMFAFEKMIFKVMDVGGQRSERRKWIHCFDSVTAVLFTCSLSGFDQVLREDRKVNRMMEALNLFEDVVNYSYFADAAIILFLNKTDLFKAKLAAKVDLTQVFPNYTGGFDYDSASQFIKSRFIERVFDSKQIHVHFTCAVDTQNVRHVVNDVRIKVIMNISKDFVL